MGSQETLVVDESAPCLMSAPARGPGRPRRSLRRYCSLFGNSARKVQRTAQRALQESKLALQVARELWTAGIVGCFCRRCGRKVRSGNSRVAAFPLQSIPGRCLVYVSHGGGHESPRLLALRGQSTHRAHSPYCVTSTIAVSSLCLTRLTCIAGLQDVWDRTCSSLVSLVPHRRPEYDLRLVTDRQEHNPPSVAIVRQVRLRHSAPTTVQVKYSHSSA